MATAQTTAVPAPEAEEPVEPLKYKTWVLKVSIHCEGCKRKVKKILHGIEGVYTTDVDTKSHRVVVIGDVDSEALIKKLEKSGKHAELWGQQPNQKERKSNRSKKKQNDPNAPEDSSNTTTNPVFGNEEGPDTVAEQNCQPPMNGDPTSGGKSKVVVEVGNSAKGGQVQEARVEPGKKPDNNAPADQVPLSPEVKDNQGGGPAENNGCGGGNAGSGGGGGSGKRRKKKGRKGNNSNPNTTTHANPEQGGVESSGNNHGNFAVNGPANTQPSHQPQGAPPVYRSPPRSYPVYDNPPPYYAAPPQHQQPIYAVSYNTAYPSSSYTASYYAAPPPYSSSYVQQYYGHGGTTFESADGAWNGGTPQPSDTFEIFSDENPNACSVM